VDREQIAREVRRRQVQESLTFEQEREQTLHEQVELVIAEAEGPRIDAAVFERMPPEDAEIVRADLTPPTHDTGPAPGYFERDDVIFLDDEADVHDEELARLNEELEDCRRRQRAFQAYLDALGG
jgi:uncharacterized protein YecE (DUF72 family)